MQIIHKAVWNYLDSSTPTATAAGELAKDLKKKTEKFLSFAEAPFKAEVVVVETAEDYLD